MTILISFRLGIEFPELLNDLSFKVLWSSDPDNLRELAKINHIDVALEWQWGDTDFSVRDMLRQIGKSVPIIMCRNWKQGIWESDVELRNQGYSTAIDFPFQLEEFIAICERLTTPKDIKIKILVIEDDLTTRDLIIETIFSRFKEAIVREASNNDDAFRILEDIKPDIITTDLAHPGGSGFEFLLKLRTRPQYSKTPVMLISRWADESEGAPLGADLKAFDDLLQKPFDLHMLTYKIERLFQTKVLGR